MNFDFHVCVCGGGGGGGETASTRGQCTCTCRYIAKLTHAIHIHTYTMYIVQGRLLCLRECGVATVTFESGVDSVCLPGVLHHEQV